jgi:hypothetical protein
MSEPMIGQSIKVHLRGESPWAKCAFIYPDGSWDGVIENKLFHEYSEAERAGWVGSNFEGVTKPLPKLHDYKQGQVVRFEKQKTDEWGIWVPSDKKAATA